MKVVEVVGAGVEMTCGVSSSPNNSLSAGCVGKMGEESVIATEAVASAVSDEIVSAMALSSALAANGSAGLLSAAGGAPDDSDAALSFK